MISQSYTKLLRSSNFQLCTLEHCSAEVQGVFTFLSKPTIGHTYFQWPAYLIHSLVTGLPCGCIGQVRVWKLSRASCPTLRPRQNCHHLADNIVRHISSSDNGLALNRQQAMLTAHYLNQWWPSLLVHIYVSLSVNELNFSNSVHWIISYTTAA